MKLVQMRSSVDFVAGGIASCVSEVLTLPMDTVKVRLQINQNKAKGSLPAMILAMLKEEGLQSFFNGIKPAVLRQALYGSLRYGLYPIFKGIICNGDCGDQLLKRLAAGCSAGALASALCNPTDLVKVRMQANQNSKLFMATKKDEDISQELLEYNYDGLYDAFSTIVKREGFLALYTGVGPTVCRASVLAAVEMATYDVLRDRIAYRLALPISSLVVHALTALIASFLSSLASNPFDMARSRVMNQPKKNGRGLLYNGAIDCLFKVVRQEGFSVLLAGFWAFFFRLGPNTMITFMIIEQLRIFFGAMLP